GFQLGRRPADELGTSSIHRSHGSKRKRCPDDRKGRRPAAVLPELPVQRAAADCPPACGRGFLCRRKGNPARNEPLRDQPGSSRLPEPRLTAHAENRFASSGCGGVHASLSWLRWNGSAVASPLPAVSFDSQPNEPERE